MEPDPLISFLSNLSQKINVEKEHKAIMEGLEAPETVTPLAVTLANLQEKIAKQVEAHLPSEKLEETPVEAIQEQPIVIQEESEEEIEDKDNFGDFLGKLKGILANPKEAVVSEVKAPIIEEIEEELPVKEIEAPVVSTPKSGYVQELERQSKPPAAKKTTEDYTSELDKISSKIANETEPTKVADIKKLLEEYAEKYLKKAAMMAEYAGGGGTNAVQYANGGTMNGSLNVTGQYLSGGVDIATLFSTGSGGGGGGNAAVNSIVISSSANWNSTYTTVQSNSASWGTGGTAQNLSFDPNTANLSITNGNTVSLSSLSATGSSGNSNVNALVISNSAYWNTAYNVSTAYQEVSSSFATIGFTDSKYLPLSGGELTGDLIVDANITVGTSGNTYNINYDGSGVYHPFIINYNNNNASPIFASSPTGEVIFAGTNAFFGFSDRSDTTNRNNDGGFYKVNGVINFWNNVITQNTLSIADNGDVHVGVNGYGSYNSDGTTSNMPYKFEVTGGDVHFTNNLFIDGSINATGSATFASNQVIIDTSGKITLPSGDSDQWTNAYTNLVSNSAAYLSGSDLSFLSVSGNWNNSYTALTANSAFWQSTYTTLCATSSTWVTYSNLNTASFVKYTDISSVSSNWNTSYTIATGLTSLSSNWQSSYTTVSSNSANWNTSYTIATGLTSLSSNWQSTYTTLCANSGYWNTSYTLVQNNSASWNNALSSYAFIANGSVSIFNLSSTKPFTNAAGYIVSMNGAIQTPNSDFTITYSGTNYLNLNFTPRAGALIDVQVLGNGVITNSSVVTVSSSTYNPLYTYVNSNFNVNTPTGNYMVDTTTSGVTGTLPTTPTLGTVIGFMDPYYTWNTKNFTLSAPTNIENQNQLVAMNIAGYSFKAIYVGGSYGWRIIQ